MRDDQPGPGDVRVFDRLLAAGLTLERIEEHLAAGRVRVDGELVTDPYRAAHHLRVSCSTRNDVLPGPLAARDLAVRRVGSRRCRPAHTVSANAK